MLINYYQGVKLVFMSNQGLDYGNITEYNFTNNQDLHGIELNAQYPHQTKNEHNFDYLPVCGVCKKEKLKELTGKSYESFRTLISEQFHYFRFNQLADFCFNY